MCPPPHSAGPGLGRTVLQTALSTGQWREVIWKMMNSGDSPRVFTTILAFMFVYSHLCVLWKNSSLYAPIKGKQFPGQAEVFNTNQLGSIHPLSHLQSETNPRWHRTPRAKRYCFPEGLCVSLGGTKWTSFHSGKGEETWDLTPRGCDAVNGRCSGPRRSTHTKCSRVGERKYHRWSTVW